MVSLHSKRSSLLFLYLVASGCERDLSAPVVVKGEWTFITRYPGGKKKQRKKPKDKSQERLLRRLPYGRIFSQVFYNKKRSCDHLGGFVWREIYLILWKYDFYDVSLAPIVKRELFVKLFRWEQLWEWSELTGLPLHAKGGTTPTGNRLKRPWIVLKLRTKGNDNLTLR